MDPADDTKIIFTENNVIYYLAGGERKKERNAHPAAYKSSPENMCAGRALNNKRFNLVWGTTPPQGANHIERE